MILLADSGSTKTDWVLLDKTGELKRLATVGFNPDYQQTEGIYQELRKSLLPQLVGVAPTKIFFYGAGCSTPRKVKEVTDAIQLAFPAAQVFVDHDLMAAARALCGDKAGLPCILGTGCNSSVFDGENIIANVPSLGFWLGDEGSGGYMGRQLVIWFMNNELPADLQKAFTEQFPDTNYAQVMEHVYRKQYPNRFLASFATFLEPHREHPFIQQLLRDSFTMFFKRQLGKYPEHKHLPAHFIGSIAFFNQEILKEVAEENGFKIEKILRSPLDGLVEYHLKLLQDFEEQ